MRPPVLSFSARGVRQGDVLAPALFVCYLDSLARHLELYVHAMQDDGLLEPGEFLLYMDDMVVLVSAASPVRQVQMTAAVLEFCCQHLQSLGLSLNLAPGKTEVLMALRGRGTAEAKATCRAERCTGTQIGRVPFLSSHACRWVRVYKYLGVYVSTNGCLGSEVRHRKRMARDALRMMRTSPILRSAVSRRVRWHCFEAQFKSKLLYGCESWPELSFAHWSALLAEDCRAMKCDAPIKYGDDRWSWDVADFEPVLDAIPLEGVLAKWRIRHLHRLAVSVPDLGRRFCTPLDNSWLQAVQNDVRWWHEERSLPEGVESFFETGNLCWLEQHARFVSAWLAAWRPRARGRRGGLPPPPCPRCACPCCARMPFLS